MYGIIYLWYDRKHKRFYLGSHWGTENDGYICSSTHMKRAHKRRPEDFKRRILKRIYTDRKTLLEEEYRFLQMIKPEELKTRYYNRTNRKFNHWSTEDIKKVKKTISEKTREAMWKPEVREKYIKGLQLRDMSFNKKPETKEKRKECMIRIWEIRSPKENRYIPLKFNSQEYIENMKKSCKKAWKNKTEESKLSRNKKISESLKNSKQYRSELMSNMKWWNNGKIRTRAIEQPGPDWKLGKTI